MADPGYRWRDGHPQRRAAWLKHLTTHGPVQCGCPGDCHHHDGHCPVWIQAGDAWDLGHGIALAYGGDGTDSTPWCTPCNRRAAAWMTNHRANASRDWWG